jgi:hypothetical protein
MVKLNSQNLFRLEKLTLDPARLHADDFPSILSRVTEGLAQ